MSLVRQAERLVDELVACGATTEQRVRAEAAGTRALDHLTSAGQLFSSLIDEHEQACGRRRTSRRRAPAYSMIVPRRRTV